MKRILAVVLVLVLAAAGTYWYLSGNDMPFFKDTSIYKAIPVSSPFFFEVNSARAVSPSNAILAELDQAGIGSEWFDFIRQADSLVNANESLSKNFLNSPFLLAYSVSGRNQMVPLIIKRAESHGQQAMAENFFQLLYPPQKFRHSKKEYGKYQIHEITRTPPDNPVFYSFAGGNLLVSTRSIIVEQSIRQMENPGILKNPFFQDVNRSAGSQGISLFINHAYLPGFLGSIMNRASTERIDEFGSTLRFQPVSTASKFKDYAGWSALDFKLTNSQVLLQGISAADDSLNHFLSVFHGQQPVRHKVEEALPQNISFFCSYTFSGKKDFFEKLEDFFAHSPDFYHREERMKRFDRGLRADVRKVFMELVKDEVTVAASAIPVNPQNKTVYFLMNTSSMSGAESQLNKLLANYAVRAGTDLAQLKSEFKIDNEVSFPVYRFPYPSLPGLWLGSPYSMAEARFVTFHNNYMVFSNSERGLQEYLRNMVLGTTLAKDLRYQVFRKSTSDRSNIHVFVDVNKIFGYRKELFADALVKPVDAREDHIRKFGMVSWQVLSEKNTYRNAVSLSRLGDAGSEALTTWQSMIGAGVRSKPYMFVNHQVQGDRDVVFQDEQHNLLQVSSSGRIRWSVPLSGPIMGEIHQIDYFRNGRLQYLFNTKDKIFLIDRNGNNVQGFPIALRSPATNGVSFFDYDRNRNYRFFIACEDLKVYGWDHAGKIIQGWKFGTTSSHVMTPLQHFKVAGKDYIVFKDKSQIYMLDRQGEIRVQPAARFENSSSPLVLYSKENPRLVATDITGKVYYIYFDGKTEERKTARFGPNHFFTVDDLDGNGTADFIFTDGSELTVIDENGKRLFSKKHSNALVYIPKVYTFSENLKKIGVVDASLNRIYLYSPDGKLHEGFPLQGNSEFSIGKLSSNASGLNLVVGSEGGLLFNYTLN